MKEEFKAILAKEKIVLDPSGDLVTYLRKYRELFCADEYTLSPEKIEAWYVDGKLTKRTGDADGFLPASFYDKEEDMVTGKVNKHGKKLDLDVVDLNKWWEACYKVFPVLTVTHSPGLKDVEEVKKKMLSVYEERGYLAKIQEILTLNPKAKILEIGPGYGQVHEWMMKLHPEARYFALDVSRQFDCKTLFIGDGKSFPRTLSRTRFDFVFSSNCFQHLSYKQKVSYFEAISTVLKAGCEFWFDACVIPTLNGKDDEYLKHFNPMCNFFGQRVPVQKDTIILDDLSFNDLKPYNVVLEPYLASRMCLASFKCLKKK